MTYIAAAWWLVVAAMLAFVGVVAGAFSGAFLIGLLTLAVGVTAVAVRVVRHPERSLRLASMVGLAISLVSALVVLTSTELQAGFIGIAATSVGAVVASRLAERRARARQGRASG